eukprot:14025338-Alexandrium_andersonii.AAC.1
MIRGAGVPAGRAGARASGSPSGRRCLPPKKCPARSARRRSPQSGRSWSRHATLAAYGRAW